MKAASLPIVPVSFSSPSNASTSWTAPASTGIQTLTLTVMDSRGLSSSIALAVNVGGYNGTSEGLLPAELYDPVSGTWSATGSPPQYRGDAATLLLSGKVLSVDAFGAEAELYDPVSDTWSPTGSLNVASRDGITATRLLDGRVLAVGTTIGDEDTESAELYTP